ncbi:MAG TPA: hypothetical protein VFW80_01850 [Gaiellaceae bacterium]|nr:hypothetical protein [Gaiellaceae bacterium]
MTGTPHALSAEDLARDAPVATLASDLHTWKYVRGAEVEYRGDSSRFSSVVSRTLLFATPAGARSYVTMVGANPAAFMGLGTTVAPVRSNGRSGYLLTAGSCGCATEVPQLLAVVSAGRTATWLEATGRRTSRSAVLELLRFAP